MFQMPDSKGFITAPLKYAIFTRFSGRLRMNELGWKTHLGRSSQRDVRYYYFRNPCGGAAEYGYDTDRVTDNWIPRSIERPTARLPNGRWRRD